MSWVTKFTGAIESLGGKDYVSPPKYGAEEIILRAMFKKHRAQPTTVRPGAVSGSYLRIMTGTDRWRRPCEDDIPLAPANIPNFHKIFLEECVTKYKQDVATFGAVIQKLREDGLISFSLAEDLYWLSQDALQPDASRLAALVELQKAQQEFATFRGEFFRAGEGGVVNG